MSERQGPRTPEPPTLGDESPRTPSFLFDPFADPESTSSSSGRSSIRSSSQVPIPTENRDPPRPSLDTEAIVADPEDAIVRFTI
jgi:hypothetical protein